MRPQPSFGEVPPPRRWDFQYRWYVILLFAFALFALLTMEWRAAALLAIPALAVSLVLWLRRWRNPWIGKGARYAPKRTDSRIQLGWSRASNPHYAARGTTLFPHGEFGGGSIRDGYASLPLAIAATLCLLPALLGGVVIGFALWLKRQFRRVPDTFLIR